MRIKRFEDLECWQKSRELTKIIYNYASRPDFSKDFRLSGQITGAAISIMNNISEGFDSGSKFEFVRFLKYSRRSCSETQNCLYIALDQNYISTVEFDTGYADCERVRKIVDGLIRYLRTSQIRKEPDTQSGGQRDRHPGLPADRPTSVQVNRQTDPQANGKTQS
jgi:four helix bundle protein